MIEEASKECEAVTPPVLAAILFQESSFNPRASSGEAHGIAQFTPETWQTWGKDPKTGKVGDIWNPEDAIPASARYLCSLYDTAKEINKKYDTDDTELEMMAAAYNGGPGILDPNTSECGTAGVPRCGDPNDPDSYAGQTYPYAKEKFPEHVKMFSK